MNAAPTKSTTYQPTPAVVRNNGTKAHASFSGNTALNSAQRGSGPPTVAVIKKNKT